MLRQGTWKAAAGTTQQTGVELPGFVIPIPTDAVYWTQQTLLNAKTWEVSPLSDVVR